MRKFIPTSLLAFAAPFAAFAQVDIVDPPPVVGSTPPVSVPGIASGVPESIGDFYGLVCTASDWLFAFVLIVAVIVLLFGAVQFFTARGDETSVASARSYITYALVGVAVAVLARALVFVVGSFIGLNTPSTSLFGC